MACSRSMSNDEIKHRIRNVFAKFVSDVDPNQLSDWLVQEGVISIDQWQSICQENRVKKERCRALLNHLFSTQHPKAFLVVRQALSEQNHYLFEDIDKQESKFECSVQLDAKVILQEKNNVEKLEKKDEDQKSVWEEEKDRLLDRITELEKELHLNFKKIKQLEQDNNDQKEERDRLLKAQKEAEAKRRLDENKVEQLKKDFEDQKRVWEADKDCLLKTLKELETKLFVVKTNEQLERDYEDQRRSWEIEKNRLLKTQKQLERKLPDAINRLGQLEKDVVNQTRTSEDKSCQLKMLKELEAKFSAGDAMQNVATTLEKTFPITRSELSKKRIPPEPPPKPNKKPPTLLPSKPYATNEQLERNYEDQKRLWETGKCRQLETEKELETKISEDKFKVDQMERDVADQTIATGADKDPLLKLEKDFVTGLHVENREKSLNPKEKLKQQLKENEERIMVLVQENQKLQAKLRYNSDPVLIKTIRTKSYKKRRSWLKAAEDGKYISGMTILDKELFVATDKSSEVDVYDMKYFSFSRRWNLKELITPFDIASCDRSKCLYIFNCKGNGQPNEILRVDPLGKLINSWSTGDDWGWGLSVTNESNLILAVRNGNKVNEYSPYGQLIRNINLSSDLCAGSLRHAVKLTSGHFIICLAGFSHDLHRVCIVDEEGQIKKAFDRKRRSNFEQRNSPIHLSVDANGSVTVIDGANSLVLLLDSDLQFKGEIRSKDGHELRYLKRILLDESNSRLLVVNNDPQNKQIFIFQYEN